MNLDDVKKQAAEKIPALETKAKKLLLKKPLTLEDLANQLDCSPKMARKVVDTLVEKHHTVSLAHGEIRLGGAQSETQQHTINPKLYEGRKYRFGIVSDNHLCSKYSRLDVLNSLYDIFEKEGISDVYNAGNMLDGECRFNKHELIVRAGMEAQLEYAAKHYPQRKGVTTHYIVGDDHEGWWAQREGINVGRAMQDHFEEAGRTDMHYLGYLEADVRLKTSKGSVWLRVMHPGGGSAYALSYAPQKIVESFQGGEKPAILIIGHYHKMDFCCPREVFCISAGTTEDQSAFMRKNKIQAFVGGWVCEAVLAPEGYVSSLSADWRRYYDRAFCEGQEKFARW